MGDTTRRPSGQGRPSVEEYRAEVLRLVGPTPTVRLPLHDAGGLVLAEDLRATESVPRFPASAMDGYAVRWVDIAHATPGSPVALTVVGEVAAGSSADPELDASCCVRIMTGAAVPSAADTVVPSELTDDESAARGTVLVQDAPATRLGAHVRHPGEDTLAGDLVLAAGTRLIAHRIGAAAAAGHATVPVHRRPRVAVVSTGDELRPPGTPLDRGQIYESNSAFLAEAARADGVEVERVPAASDDPTAFTRLVEQLAARADLVVLSGGVGGGRFDVSRLVLDRLPDSAFRSVRMQPGKPQGWARWHDGTPVLALPGNPVAAAVSYVVFVRPALYALQGRPGQEPVRRAVAARSWDCPDGRAQLMPVRLCTEPDGRTVATPTQTGAPGSHLVTRLAQADGFAHIPAPVEQVLKGDLLTVLPL